MSLSELDRDRLFHPYTSIHEHQAKGGRVMVEGKGIRVRDAEGREYLDAMAGLWCVNVGYGRDEIAEAMAEQARRLPYYHAFLRYTNEPAVRLADRVLAMAPASMRRAFFCNSGSEANDTIIKLVWYTQSLRGKPGKRKLLSRWNAYHGVTIGTASLSGLPAMHEHFGLPMPEVHHLRKPHHYREGAPGEREEAFSERLADELDATIRAEGPDTVGAFFAEPLMAAGGVIVPPRGYWPAIQEVLRAHDVLLVADEVVCGFGRLGRPFGSQRYGIEPDFMTLAKGITSAYFPVSAALVGERVWSLLESESPEGTLFAHGHTTSAHPVGAAAALANLAILEREQLVERADRLGHYLQQRLRECFGEHPLVGEVRGEGLIAGIELVADKATRAPFPPSEKRGLQLYELLLDEGLVSRAVAGDTLAFCPPLIVSESEIDEICDRFGRGLDRLVAALPGFGS